MFAALDDPPLGQRRLPGRGGVTRRDPTACGKRRESADTWDLGEYLPRGMVPELPRLTLKLGGPDPLKLLQAGGQKIKKAFHAEYYK